VISPRSISTRHVSASSFLSRPVYNAGCRDPEAGSLPVVVRILVTFWESLLLVTGAVGIRYLVFVIRIIAVAGAVTRGTGQYGMQKDAVSNPGKTKSKQADK